MSIGKSKHNHNINQNSGLSNGHNAVASTKVMQPPPPRKFNLFTQNHTEFEDYRTSVYKVIKSDVNFGTKVNYSIPHEKISCIGNVILTVTLPALVASGLKGDAAWVSNLGYSMIKSYGWILKNNTTLKFDKYHAMKLLHTQFKSAEIRDEILKHAGNTKELVNIGSGNGDKVIKPSTTINILLPLPNMNLLSNTIRVYDKEVQRFFVEFEPFDYLINKSTVTDLVPTAGMLTALSLECFQCDALNPVINQKYVLEYNSDEYSDTTIIQPTSSELKEVTWIADSMIYSSGKCQLPFCPRFNSSDDDIITDYIDSIIHSLVILKDSHQTTDGVSSNTKLVKVSNYTVNVGSKKIVIIIKGLPVDMDVYYNTNILIKSMEGKPDSIDVNVSEYFDEIIADYYPEIDRLIFSKIRHSLTIDIASMPLDTFRYGANNLKGDNRLCNDKNKTFNYRDYFKLGKTLSCDSFTPIECSIDYGDKNLYKASSEFTHLFNCVKYATSMPKYLTSFTFTATPGLNIITAPKFDNDNGNIKINLDKFNNTTIKTSTVITSYNPLSG